MNFRYIFLVVIFSSFFLSGCATNRGIVRIKVPESKELIQDNGKEIFIKLPVDKRVYEKNPSAHNVPSLNPRRTQTGSVKERAFGRKSDGFNERIGDVLLPRKKSVALLMQKTLRQAFLEKGFKIIEDEENISEKTYIVSTNILTFWSWQDRDFLSEILSGEISTDLMITTPDGLKSQLIAVKVVHREPRVLEKKWRLLMSDAVAVYIDSLKKQLKE